MRVVSLGFFLSAVVLWLAVLALPRVALAKSPYKLSLYLQTDRPAYVVGEAVRMRFNVTDRAVSYLSFVPILRIVDSRGKPVRDVTGDPQPAALGRPAKPQFPPGNTTLQTCGWRTRSGVCRQWWSYYFGGTGKYTIIADGNLWGERIKPSPPVTIQILGRATAKVWPVTVLSDSAMNATFRSLETEYVSLRSTLLATIWPRLDA